MTPAELTTTGMAYMAAIVALIIGGLNAYFTIKATWDAKNTAANTALALAVTTQKTDAAQSQLNAHSEDIKALIGGGGKPITDAMTAHADMLKDDLSEHADQLSDDIAAKAAVSNKTTDWDKDKMQAAHDAIAAALAPTPHTPGSFTDASVIITTPVAPIVESVTA